jgi:hypothetical protein
MRWQLVSRVFSAKDLGVFWGGCRWLRRFRGSRRFWEWCIRSGGGVCTDEFNLSDLRKLTCKHGEIYLTFIFIGLAAAGRWGALDNKRDGERFAHSFAGVGHGGGT